MKWGQQWDGGGFGVRMGLVWGRFWDGDQGDVGTGWPGSGRLWDGGGDFGAGSRVALSGFGGGFGMGAALGRLWHCVTLALGRCGMAALAAELWGCSHRSGTWHVPAGPTACPHKRPHKHPHKRPHNYTTPPPALPSPQHRALPGLTPQLPMGQHPFLSSLPKKTPLQY